MKLTKRTVVVATTIGALVMAAAGILPAISASAGTQPARAVTSTARDSGTVLRTDAPATLHAEATATAQPQQVKVPEKELMPIVDRVRAIESEVTALRAELAQSRRENAQALSALRNQHAELQDAYSKHRHVLNTGFINAMSICEGVKQDVNLYINNGKTMPPTSGPVP